MKMEIKCPDRDLDGHGREGAERDGSFVFGGRSGLPRGFRRLYSIQQPHAVKEENSMESWYLIAGLLAAGLLVYLSIVLLKPEIFS